MTNLAEAVERSKRCFVACAPDKECECRERVERQAMTDKELSEFGIDEALLGLRHLLSELPDHDFRLERHGLESGIEALLAMNNRLAELGSGAGGEVAATLIHSPDELTRVDISMHGMGLGYGKHDLFTPPPVAGLAELTDAANYRWLRDNEATIIYKRTADSRWEPVVDIRETTARGRTLDEAIAAARQFLGKVDGQA